MQDSRAPVLAHVEFRSDRFPADPDESEIVNPGLWGRRLALFLRDGLRARGFHVDEPFPEDWGWALRVERQPFRMWIGCGHYQEYPDGYLCFIEPHKPFVWKLFRRVETRAAVGAMQRALDEILSAEGIRERRWWTTEEGDEAVRGWRCK